MFQTYRFVTMLQFFTIITTITGLFTILDLFIEKNAKNKVAEYVFGFGSANLSAFEGSVISALLSPFKSDGRLSFSKILWRYSFVIFILCYILSRIAFYSYNPDHGFIVVSTKSLMLLVIGVLFCWPFDCYSLWITNKLFAEKNSKNIADFILRIIADIILTILPLIGVLAALILLTPETFENDFLNSVVAYSAIFFLINLASSIMISVLQIVTLVIGIILRFLLKLTKINQHIAMVSRANEFPFSFIGLISGIFTALFTAILT